MRGGGFCVIAGTLLLCLNSSFAQEYRFTTLESLDEVRLSTLTDEQFAEFDKRVQQNPNDVAARHQRGTIYQNRGDFERALSDFNEAIRLNPKLAPAYMSRGMVYETIKQYSNAFADLDLAIQFDPMLHPAFANRGVLKCNSGNHQAAIADLNEAIRLRPADSRYYGIRGEIWQRSGNLAKAINDFTEAINTEKAIPAKYYRKRGFALQEKREYQLALADYDAAIQSDPTSWLSFYRRGNCRIQLADIDRAIDDLSEAIRLDPQQAKVYVDRGLAWQKKGRIDRSIDDFDQAIRLNPKDTNAYVRRGEAWELKGRLDKAFEDAQTSIKFKVTPDGLLLRGRIYYSHRLFGRALSDIEGELELSPDVSSAVALRASTLLNLGDVDQALLLFEGNSEQIFNGPQCYLTRAKCWEAKRAFELAQADYETAARIYPNEPDCHVSLIWFYAACPDGRFRDWQHAVTIAINNSSKLWDLWINDWLFKPRLVHSRAVIDEGRGAFVSKVRLRRSNKAPSGEVLAVLDRAKARVLRRSRGRYQPSDYAADILQTRGDLMGLGYMDANVKLELKYSSDNSQVELEFTIQEGTRCKIKDFEFKGEYVQAEDQLREILPIKVGDYKDDAQLWRAVNALQMKCRNEVSACYYVAEEGAITVIFRFGKAIERETIEINDLK